jgi:hypothetical protein
MKSSTRVITKVAWLGDGFRKGLNPSYGLKMPMDEFGAWCTKNPAKAKAYFWRLMAVSSHASTHPKDSEPREESICNGRRGAARRRNYFRFQGTAHMPGLAAGSIQSRLTRIGSRALLSACLDN